MTTTTRSLSRRSCSGGNWNRLSPSRTAYRHSRRTARRARQIGEQLEQIHQLVPMHVANELRLPRIRQRADAPRFRGVRRLRRPGLRHWLASGRPRDRALAGRPGRTMLRRRLPSRSARVLFLHRERRTIAYTLASARRDDARDRRSRPVWSREGPTTTQTATLTITMDTSLNFDGRCPGVFVAYLTNERGQRICFPRRRLRATLAKEEYATTWQEED